MDTKTRVFFVTDSRDENPELHTTMESAIEYYEKYLKKQKGSRVYIAKVKHTYQEKNGNWNYNDLSDTFDIVEIIKLKL